MGTLADSLFNLLMGWVRALHDLLRLPLVHLRLLERQPLFFFFLFRRA